MLRIGFSLPLCHCLWQWERNLGMRYDCAWCLCFLLLLKQQRQQQRRRCRSSPCHGSVARCCCVGWIFFAALRGTASADERKKATVLAVGHQAQRVCLSVWTPLRQNSKSSTTRHPESKMTEFRILASQQLFHQMGHDYVVSLVCRKAARVRKSMPLAVRHPTWIPCCKNCPDESKCCLQAVMKSASCGAHECWK